VTRVPKYLQLRQQVMELIDSLPTGAAIPSERELCTMYGVSRMTLRRALDELASNGYLVRRQGAPTATARPKIAQRMAIRSFTEDMRARGMEASSRLLSFGVHAAGARLGLHLHVSPEEPVVTVGRLRLADGDPMAIEWMNVPATLVPGIEAADLTNGSFYALLGGRYGVEIGGGSQTVEPTVADEQEARLLGVPLHSPALFVERSIWTPRNEVIEFVQSTYRGDRYRFEMELTPAVVVRASA
jgi:GntR family transcriptional regulator